jgi:hypothetical protein
MKTCSGRMFWLDCSVDDVTNSTVELISCNNFYNSYFNAKSSALVERGFSLLNAFFRSVFFLTGNVLRVIM